MPIPVIYRKSNENALTSYDWYDLANGVGYKTFYPMFTNQGTNTEVKILTPEPLYSSKIASGNAATNNTFNLTFTKHATIGGDVSLSIPAVVYGDTSISMAIKIYKSSGGVDTQLGSTTSATLTTAHGAQYLWGATGFNVVVPTTTFANGDILKLQIESTNPQASTQFFYFHDPASRSVTSALNDDVDWGMLDGNAVTGVQSTASKLNIPFKIDL